MNATSNIKSIEDLKKLLIEIKKKGWLPSHRKHDTGIGKTFEDLLGIKENNLQLPDIGNIEVKSSREYTKSMITLITFEPPKQYRNINWKLEDLLKNFGATGKEKGLEVFHLTVSYKNYTNNKQKFKLEELHVDGKNMICIVTQNKFENISNILPRNAIACYPLDEVLERVTKKISGCLLVIEASTRKEGSLEEFRLEGAKLYTGFSVENFLNLIRNGKIKLDMRFGRDKNGNPHNHGTGWRISKKDLLKLYSKEIDLLREDIPKNINCYEVNFSKQNKNKKITDYILFSLPLIVIFLILLYFHMT